MRRRVVTPVSGVAVTSRTGWLPAVGGAAPYVLSGAPRWTADPWSGSVGVRRPAACSVARRAPGGFGCRSCRTGPLGRSGASCVTGRRGGAGCAVPPEPRATDSAAASWSGRGLDTSLARIAASTVIFMPAITPSTAQSAPDTTLRANRPGSAHRGLGTSPRGQKIRGHQGAGSQDRAVERAARAPGVASVARPARASVPSRVPPR